MDKMTRLQKLVNEEGMIAISALDHRGLLKKMLHPENPEVTSESEITDWKRKMVGLYKNLVSGLLIDPTYGRNLLDHTAKCGWIFSMEQTGYEGGEEARVTRLIPDWSVGQARELGASAVKLLLYYDPNNRELAKIQKETAAKVAEECVREGMVFLLEPLSYTKEKDENVVEKIVDDLIDLPVDIFKLEFPGDLEKCLRITKKLTVPWVLLSAGVSYELYREQLETACKNGAKGMAVGRAAWQEFGQYPQAEREKFLEEVAVTRIKELVMILAKYGNKGQG